MYKITLLLFTFVLLGLKLQAQGVITPALSDTVLVNETEDRDYVSYFKDTDRKVTAVVLDYHANGSLKMRRSVVEGLSEGIWMEWYETGIPRYIGEWKGGKGHGTWMYFHENGELSERAQVRDDIWDGLAEGWHANGKKSFQGHYSNYQKTGEWKEWTESGIRKIETTEQN